MTQRRLLIGVPFFAVHLFALGGLFVGFTPSAVACCVVLYLVRMFGITGGYHRYFAHRTFRTSRPMQFALAWLAVSSAQKGVLWWAAHHRRHHKHSDTEQDVHSPVQRGFWYSHVGWIFDGNEETDWARVKDLSKYPELVWLNRWHLVPPVTLGVAVYLLLGLPGLFTGFMLSTVLTWHSTYLINSLAHVVGRRRYDTADDSRNNLLLALLTLGEGWHNNHHHYPRSTRQGFFWWEIDVTWYVLRGLERLGLVWDLHQPPAHVLRPAVADGAEATGPDDDVAAAA